MVNMMVNDADDADAMTAQRFAVARPVTIGLAVVHFVTNLSGSDIVLSSSWD